MAPVLQTVAGATGSLCRVYRSSWPSRPSPKRRHQVAAAGSRSGQLSNSKYNPLDYPHAYFGFVPQHGPSTTNNRVSRTPPPTTPGASKTHIQQSPAEPGTCMTTSVAQLAHREMDLRQVSVRRHLRTQSIYTVALLACAAMLQIAACVGDEVAPAYYCRLPDGTGQYRKARCDLPCNLPTTFAYRCCAKAGDSGCFFGDRLPLAECAHLPTPSCQTHPSSLATLVDVMAPSSTTAVNSASVTAAAVSSAEVSSSVPSTERGNTTAVPATDSSSSSTTASTTTPIYAVGLDLTTRLQINCGGSDTGSPPDLWIRDDQYLGELHLAWDGFPHPQNKFFISLALSPRYIGMFGPPHTLLSSPPPNLSLAGMYGDFARGLLPLPSLAASRRPHDKGRLRLGCAYCEGGSL